jgi:hypothetical protein
VVTLVAAPSATPTPAPGLVERVMYLVDAQTGATGATDMLGAPYGSTQWYFAAGYSGPQCHERYILANPSSGAATQVTVSFVRPDGSSVQQVVPLQPGQQATVSAAALLGAGAAYHSTTITASQQILAERYASFTYGGPLGQGATTAPLPGAADALGAQQASDLYYFADGAADSQSAAYLALLNPGARVVKATVSFLVAAGTAPAVRTYEVGPGRALSALLNGVLPGQDFALMVQATGPIVAERTQYVDANGSQPGGSEVLGYAPHIFPYLDQNFYSTPAYVTTDSFNAGGLDESTGLLEYPFLTDIPFIRSPVVDPSSPYMFYTIISGSPYGCTSPCPNPGYSSSNEQQIASVQPPNIAWTFAPASPQALDGTLAVGSTHIYAGVSSSYAFNAPESIDALNKGDGSLAWSTQLNSTVSSVTAGSSGPVLVLAATWVMTCGTGCYTPVYTIYALSDADGHVLWNTPVPSSYAVGNLISDTTRGLVYYSISPNGAGSNGNVEAVNASNGVVQWSDNLSYSASSPTLSPDGSSLYVNDGTGTLYALDPGTGAQQWTAPAYLVTVNDGVVLAEPDTGTNALEAFKASTGMAMWQYSLPSQYSIDTQTFIGYVEGNVLSIFFGMATCCYGSPTTIVSLNAATGAVNWAFSTQITSIFYPFPNTLPVLQVDYNHVYYATSSTTQNAVFVYGIDPVKGTLTWKTELDVPPNTDTFLGGMSIPYPIG